MKFFFQDLKNLLGHYIKCELSSFERFYSPLLFASTILVIFHFAFGESLPSESLSKVFVAEVFVALLFSVQMSFLRLFDLETEDQALDIMKASNIKSSALFLSKYLVTFISSCVLAVPVVALSLFFQGSRSLPSFSFLNLLMIIFLVLGGLSSLGSLLSVLLARLNSREVLYPLLFYPLSSPLFILGLQTAHFSFSGAEINPLLWVLIGLDCLYFALGFLLFDEVLV